MATTKNKKGLDVSAVPIASTGAAVRVVGRPRPVAAPAVPKT